MNTENSADFLKDAMPRLHFGPPMWMRARPLPNVGAISAGRNGLSLADYWTLEGLFARRESERFPFENWIVQIMALTALLWPNEQERLTTAARVACGLLHIHAKYSHRALASKGIRISQNKLQAMDRAFFNRIGGVKTLFLYEEGLASFLLSINRRLDALVIPRAIAHYLNTIGMAVQEMEKSQKIVSSDIKRLLSMTAAYEAIRSDIFETGHSFSVLKDKSTASCIGYLPRATAVGNDDAIETRLREAPDTLLLLNHFLMCNRELLFDWRAPNVFASLISRKRPLQSTFACMTASREALSPRLAKSSSIVRRWLNVKTPKGGEIQFKTMPEGQLHETVAILKPKRRGRPATRQQ